MVEKLRCDDCGVAISISSQGWAAHSRSRGHVSAVARRESDSENVSVTVDANGHGSEEGLAALRAEIVRLRAENASLKDVEAELASNQARIGVLESETKRLRPTAAWDFATTTEDVIERMGGYQSAFDEANRQLVRQDRDRNKKGLMPFRDLPDFTERVEEQIAKNAADVIRRSQTMLTDLTHIPKLRMVKMITPDGSLVQIPVAPEINNGAGSLADPIVRYQRKGFKIAVSGSTHPTPGVTFCPTFDCWRIAAVEAGEYIFFGYCSDMHRRHIEGSTVNTGEGRPRTMVNAPFSGVR